MQCDIQRSGSALIQFLQASWHWGFFTLLGSHRYHLLSRLTILSISFRLWNAASVFVANARLHSSTTRSQILSPLPTRSHIELTPPSHEARPHSCWNLEPCKKRTSTHFSAYRQHSATQGLRVNTGWGSHNTRWKVTERYQRSQLHGHKMCLMADDTEMHLHLFQDGSTEQEMILHVLKWRWALSRFQKFPYRASADLGLTSYAWHEKNSPHVRTTPFWYSGLPALLKEVLQTMGYVFAHQLQRTCLQFIPKQEY